MNEYIPIFERGNRELLILNNAFLAEDCLEYAYKHSHDVLFIQTTSTLTTKVMMMFAKKGYRISMREVESIAPDGTELNPDIYILLTHEDNIVDEDTIIDNAVILLEKTVEEIENFCDGNSAKLDTELTNKIRKFLGELGVDVWTERMIQEHKESDMA